MVGKFNPRIFFIIVSIAILGSYQFISIRNAASYTLSSNSTNEFFTGKTDACQYDVSNCDSLVQYGIFDCVNAAAKAGFFFAGGGKTVSQNKIAYNSFTSSYAALLSSTSLLTVDAGALVSDLIAYYYGVDVSSYLNSNSYASLSIRPDCETTRNPFGPGFNSGDVYSLDNIGAGFDMAQIEYGNTVSSSEITYNTSRTSNGTPITGDTYVSGLDITKFINTIANAAQNNLFCYQHITSQYNTGEDVYEGNYDIGVTPSTGEREMEGILVSPANGDCPSNPSAYQTLIDILCGNLSTVAVNPSTFKCPSGESGTYPNCTISATCSITDSVNSGSVPTGTSVNFNLNWNFSDPAVTQITSTNITQEGTVDYGNGPVSPVGLSPPEATSAAGYNSSGVLRANYAPSIAGNVIFSGSMTISYTGAYGAATSMTVNCTPDSVTWVSASTTTGSCTISDTANSSTSVTPGTSVTFNLNWQLPNPQATKINSTSISRTDSYFGTAIVTPPVLSSPVTVGSSGVGYNSSTTIASNAPSLPDTVSYSGTMNVTISGASQTINCGHNSVTWASSPPPVNTPPVNTPSGPEPYFTVNGGDIIAGSGFGNGSCSTTNDEGAGIVASNIGSTPWSGASDNLSALAPDIINGLSTGTGGDNLTFANSINSPYGGSFGSTNGICSQDYYSTSSNIPGFSSLTPATGSFDLYNVISPTSCLKYNSVYYCKLNGPVSIYASTSFPSLSDPKIVLYINGNAEISGNISIFSNYTAPLTSVSSIPFLYVISNSNIYIDNNVTSIDGVYVADNLNQTDKINTGIIYTCANSGQPYYTPSDALSGITYWNSCYSPLTINGSLVASQVKLERTGAGINPSQGTNQGTTTPSETINYGPEIWLSQTGSSSSTTIPLTPYYQDITELSPVI